MGDAKTDPNRVGKRSKNTGRVRASAVERHAGQNPCRVTPRQGSLHGLTVTLTPQTHVAVFKAINHLKAPDGINASVNALLQSACEAVMGLEADMAYQATDPLTKKDYIKGTFCSDHWPPAFTARLETEDEQFARMVLAAY